MARKKSRQSPKKLSRSPALRIFDVYRAAVELVVASLCPECEGALSEFDALAVLRDRIGGVTETGTLKDAFTSLTGFLDQGKLPTREQLRREVSPILHTIVQKRLLPPLRYVDWTLQWKGFPLLFVKDVEWFFQGRKHRPLRWSEIFNADTSSQIKADLLRYDLEYAGLMKKVESNRPDAAWFREHYRDSKGNALHEGVLSEHVTGFEQAFRHSSGASMHTVFADHLLADAFEILARDYRQTEDERAVLFFDHRNGGENVSTITARLRDHAGRVFDRITLLVERFPRRFFSPGEKVGVDRFRLPGFVSTDDLTRWRRECFVDDGPAQRLQDAVTRVRVADLFSDEPDLPETFWPGNYETPPVTDCPYNKPGEVCYTYAGEEDRACQAGHEYFEKVLLKDADTINELGAAGENLPEALWEKCLAYQDERKKALANARKRVLGEQEGEYRRYKNIEEILLLALYKSEKPVRGIQLPEAAGRGDKNIQYLTGLLGPKSVLRKDGLVANKRGAGYYLTEKGKRYVEQFLNPP